ncbi:MAG TPA: tetratricopeptide repeat protein [Gemmatimonadales bacterium]|nr:tetratricopeptide repeat protein [Gemmatimonadales bacterium]
MRTARVRLVRLVAGVTCAAASAAAAQLAVQQPSLKLLLLPLAVTTPTDSAASIATMDVGREKLGQLAKYKVVVIPKPKLCEALKASDFGCDVLLDEAQALLLARFLNVNAYSTGTLQRVGGALVATVRVRDIGSSGLAALFSVTSGNPGTPAALGEQIAQRLNGLIKAGEQARECKDQREKSQFSRAMDAARKALAIEPNLTAAHLCIATVYEAMRMPVDSLIAAALRATRGDSLNATAWETVARGYQQKGDTLKAIDGFAHELAGEPQNLQLRLGVAELLHQQKQYQKAVAILDDGLVRSPGEPKLQDLKARICIEGELWRCVLDGFVAQVTSDTAKLADSSLLKAALGAAQQLSDTQQLLFFGHAAVKHFPKNDAFWKALGAAFDLKGQKDSSLWAYKQSLALNPADLQNLLIVGKAIVDDASYDTAQATKLKSDTAALRQLRTAFADRLDSARVLLERAAAASDTTVQLNAAAIMRSAGEKLVRAGAGDRSLPWLRRALSLVTPRAPGDTTGVRQAIRVNASFWYGLAAMPGLATEYGAMTKTKSCTAAKAFNEHLDEVRSALTLGRSVHPPTVDSTLLTLGKFATAMQSVKKAFKCRNF